MSDIAKLLTQKQVHVKPAMGGWIVLEMTPLASAFDDLMSFGPFVAIHNLIWQLRGKKK